MSFSLFKQKGARTPEEIVRHVRDALLASTDHHEQSSEADTKVANEKVGRFFSNGCMVVASKGINAVC